MYKTVIITILLLLCFGVIVQAEPLPLVPGAAGTVGTEREQEKKTTQRTAAPSQTKKTEANTTSNTEVKTEKSAEENTTPKTEENVMEDKEEQVAAMDNSGNADVIQSIEKSGEGWFSLENKSAAELDSLAAALAGEGDYRSKLVRAARIIKGSEELKEQGQASPVDVRAAMDTLMGWDFTYDAY